MHILQLNMSAQNKPPTPQLNISTGLGNSWTLQKQGAAAISNSIAAGISGCVALLNLTTLETINDLMGQHEKERIVARTASVLKKYTRRQDLLAQIRSDEFVMIISDLPRSEVFTLLRKIHNEVSDLWPRGWKYEPRGIAAGTAWYPDEGSIFASLLVQADVRMSIDRRDKRTQYLLSTE